MFARRDDPPVDAAGILLIGSDAFRESAVLMEDGTLHVVPEHSKAVFDELKALRRTWKLPRVRHRVAQTPARIEILYGHDREDKAPVNRQVDDMERGARRILGVLNEVSAMGASDIKFYMRGDKCDLRVRVGNREFDHGDQWSMRDAAAAITWLYDGRAAGDGSAAQQAGTHQPFAIDAGSDVPLPDGVVSLRGQKGPIMGGHDMLTLRFQYSRDGNEAGALETLGFDDEVLDVLAAERRSDNGLVIIGGSTGDGKSTTMVRQFERLYRDRDGEVGLCTIEDPVEYPIEGRGVAQFLVDSSATGEERREEFSKVLRHFLRSAPDVAMVSEIRTKDEADQVLQFVISGHKLYTTIHSFEANHIPFRMISLGITPSEVSAPGVISLLMRQKLVPELCPHCARPATQAEAAHIAAELDATMRKDGYQSGGPDVGPSGKPDVGKRSAAAPRTSGPPDWYPASYVERYGGNGAFSPLIRNRAGCPACLDDRIERLRDRLRTYGADRLEVAVDTATSAWGGLSRRRAVAEYIRVDDTYRGFIARNDPIGAKAYWLKPQSEGGLGGYPVPVQIADMVALGEVDYVDATHDERLKAISEREQARAVGFEPGKPAVAIASGDPTEAEETAVAPPHVPHDDSSLYWEDSHADRAADGSTHTAARPQTPADPETMSDGGDKAAVAIGGGPAVAIDGTSAGSPAHNDSTHGAAPDDEARAGPERSARDGNAVRTETAAANRPGRSAVKREYPAKRRPRKRRSKR